jgi:hypothetical protein
MDQSQDKWWTQKGGIALLALYLAFTVIGIGISVGFKMPLTAIRMALPEEVSVPSYVYLYGFLGALAYIFTSLLTEFEKSLRDFAIIGLRIPAALLLVAAVYLLITFFVGEPTKPIIAGLSFLIGLYVKLALQGLGGIASRLMGKKEEIRELNEENR